MTVNMKPYDPEHKGEFCFDTRDDFDRILCTDAPGTTPIKVLTTKGVVIHCDAQGFCDYAEARIMCVIPKHEARKITLDMHGNFISSYSEWQSYAGTAWREEMPDDISQEKARAVIEAARAVVDRYWLDPRKHADAIAALRTALGDDA